jgi:hypothetical protein
MPQFNEAQIKMALTAAKDLSAAKDARRQYATLRQADVSERSETRTNQRTLENLLGSFFTKSGFEVDKFEEVLAQNQSALRRMAENRKAEAVEQSSSVKDALRYGVESRRKTIEHLATLAPPPEYEVLDTPFLIWPTVGVFFADSHYEPWNSWAKITLDSSRTEGREELSFYFLWVNPRDTFAVINVDTDLVLNGFCWVESDGGILPGTRHAGIILHARLFSWEWWNQPPTSPLWPNGIYEQALFIQTNTGAVFDDGDSEFAVVFSAHDLRHNLFLVPPQESVVFEVVLDVLYGTSEDSGSIHVDFASGAFAVLCPAVSIAIVS